MHVITFIVEIEPQSTLNQCNGFGAIVNLKKDSATTSSINIPFYIIVHVIKFIITHYHFAIALNRFI